jgi:transcriptional regulator GlxA family with amidase domain
VPANWRVAPPPETVHGALWAAVLDFVRHHLDDRGLTTSSVAAAHHVSTRTLNRVFAGHGETVGAFIRRSRLERCMRDLADPALRHQAIQDITARWCFASQTHFNRHFRETTGMTPGEYRDAALHGLAPGTENGSLHVIDHNDADSWRPVKTLSGGETFQASLSLALALSSQLGALAAAGATRLDSIFLDEGFGALDEATLDTVASMLENLAASGNRMVGVITHVATLAERVPVRFLVSRDPAGSHIVREGV